MTDTPTLDPAFAAFEAMRVSFEEAANAKAEARIAAAEADMQRRVDNAVTQATERYRTAIRTAISALESAL